MRLLTLPYSKGATSHYVDPKRFFCYDLCGEFFKKELTRFDCYQSLKVSPAPKVYLSCMNGRSRGFDASCFPVCMNTEDLGAYNSHVACAEEQGGLATAVAWCRTGYDAAIKEVQLQIPSRVNAHFNTEETSTATETAVSEDIESTLGDRRFEGITSRAGESTSAPEMIDQVSKVSSIQESTEKAELEEHKKSIKNEETTKLGQNKSQKTYKDLDLIPFWGYSDVKNLSEKFPVSVVSRVKYNHTAIGYPSLRSPRLIPSHGNRSKHEF